MKPVDVLRRTEQRLEGRGETHGSPEESFGNISELWSAYLDYDVTPHDVAAMMVLFKIARLKSFPTHLDSWMDAAGYAAFGPQLTKDLDREELPF
jgi:hypothetical protein